MTCWFLVSCQQKPIIMNAPKAQQKDSKKKIRTPFILKFIKEQKGFTSATTSGQWNDVDASDRT